MSPRDHRHRRAEIFRRPKTAMAFAFLRALQVFVQKHASDDTAPITLPTGIVTSSELAKVVCALIAIQKSPAVGEPVDQS